MTRWMLVPLFVVAVAGASCQPPPPEYWEAPTIQSIVVVPEPVVAGEPFTVSVVASDDVIVRSLELEIRPPYRLIPLYNDPYAHAQCEAEAVVPQVVVTREFTCTVPEFSPNGTWFVDAIASDGTAGYRGSRQATFELTGGSEDREAPVIEAVEVSPDPVVFGDPFRITVRVADEHHAVPAPVTFHLGSSGPGNPIYSACAPVTPEQISPTVQEWVLDGCTFRAEQAAGPYHLIFTTYDAIGHKTTEWIYFDTV